MSNLFISLKNFNELLIDLGNFHEDASPLKYVGKLVNDFTKLLKEFDFHDMEITAGKGHNFKIFKAHSIILRKRSPYFDVALSSSWERKSSNGIIIFEKKNISPRVFEIILEYIYSGILNINNLHPLEIIELIEACDELCLNEIIDDLNDYLIKEHKRWIQQNLIYVYMISQQNLFTFAQNYCNKLISEDPAFFFKSDDFTNIDKSTLISFLKMDDLALNEIEIWDHVVQWGIAQDIELEEKHFSKWNEWNENDLIKLKVILDDLIPLIRFNEITIDDFNKKIKHMKKIINEDLYKEILEHHHHLAIDDGPKLMLQKNPRSKTLLNSEFRCLISSWIDNQNANIYNENNIPYKFKLILRGSRDNISRSMFDREFGHIEQTLVVTKIQGTHELIGGYNPVGWSLKRKCPNGNYYIETDKSFIFKIDKKWRRETKLSRVQNPSEAIYIHGNDQTVYIDFNALSIKKKLGKFCCQFSDSDNNAYEKVLRFKEGVSFTEEIEFFQILKK